MKKFDLSSVAAIHAYSDLEKMLNFRQHVKLTKELEETAEVIRPYLIGPDRIPCGLTCNQGHNRGYLLRLIDGTHTNVGINCGMNHFNASNFEDQIKRIERIEEVENHKRRVNEFIDLIPNYRRQCHDLWHKSAPIYEGIERFKELFPKGLYQVLCDKARRKNSAVVVSRELSATELMATNNGLENGQASNRKYVEELVGELHGLMILVVKPRTILKIVKDCLNEVEGLEGPISDSALSRLARYHSSIKTKLAEAQDVIDQGEKFFSPHNFGLLAYLDNGRYADQVERVVWDFYKLSGIKLSEGRLKRRKQ